MSNALIASGQPSQVAHFRVKVGDHEIGLTSISPLHDLIAGEVDPELRMRVTLQRALSEDRFLYDWYRAAASGKDAAALVTIMVLATAAGEVVNRLGLQNARPVRWTGPGLNAQASSVAIEELEIRYDAVVWLES